MASIFLRAVQTQNLNVFANDISMPATNIGIVQRVDKCGCVSNRLLISRTCGLCSMHRGAPGHKSTLRWGESQNIKTAMNKWLCGLLLHCRLWPLHTIPCRKKMRKCAKLYFAGLPTLWQRKRNKVGCQQESQVKAPGGGEKFFLLVKVGTAFVFVLFVILILRRRNWAKTTNRTQAASKCNQ